nr:recombinase family protein [Frankia tisae]
MAATVYPRFMPPSPALAYERLSLDKEGKARRVAEQRALIEAQAPQLGYEISQHFEDNSRSAANVDTARPGFDDLSARLAAGPERVVLVTEISRLSRQDATAGAFITLMKRIGGVVVVVPDGTTYDFTTQDGRDRFREKAQNAIKESEAIAARVLGAHERGREARRWMGGMSPYGWRREPYLDTTGPKPVIKTRWLVDDVEGPEVREMFAAVLRGEPVYGAVSSLNERKVPPKRGELWTHAAVTGILRNPRAAGYYGRKAADGRWQIYTQPEGRTFDFPAIVDFDTWQKANALLDRVKDRRGSGYRQTLQYPLAGLFVCGACGQRTVVLSKAAKKWVRHIPAGIAKPCLADHKLSITYDDAFEYVGELIDRYIMAAPLRQRAKTTRNYDAELLEIDGQLEELVRAVVKREMTSLLAGLAEKEILERRKAVNDERAQVRAEFTPGLNWQVAAGWRGLPITEMRNVIFGVFEKIDVTPGLQGSGPFDRDRLTPHFRILDNALNDLIIDKTAGWPLVQQWITARLEGTEPDPAERVLSDRVLRALERLARAGEREGIPDILEGSWWTSGWLRAQGLLPPVDRSGGTAAD